MKESDALTITILDGGGVCLQNGDELKRLQAAGILRAKAPKKTTVHRARNNKESQAFILGQLKRKGVRDLNHYRQIVGNPRTDGLLHRFKQGAVLLMDRCPHPNQPEIAWYVVLDTAIGASVAFLSELERRRRIRIEERPE